MPNFLQNQMGVLKGKLTSSDTTGALMGKANGARLIIWDSRQTGVGASAGSSGGGTGSSLSGLAAAASSVLTGGTAAAQTSSSGVQRILAVQFNPSSLALYSNSIEVQRQNAVRDEQTGEQRVHVDSAVRPWVELSVDLIFDRVNNADAFMWDKLRQGVGGAVANGINNAIKGSTPRTVQAEVEGLLAAIRNSHTRETAFAWGDFYFRGHLRDMASEYTMFSVAGRPIRARVSLRIRQEQTQTSMDSWIRDFQTAFGASPATGAVNALRSAKNLINIGI